MIPLAANRSLALFGRSLGATRVACGAVQSIVPTNIRSYPAQAVPSFQHDEIGQIRFRSNRSRRGLYDGKDIRAGNSLSFSMKANKRKFKPNVFLKRVYSETLDEMVRFHLTASALRSIDKAGGLDNYLLKSKHVTEGEGLAVKKRILMKLKQQEKSQAWVAESIGLAPSY